MIVFISIGSNSLIICKAALEVAEKKATSSSSFKQQTDNDSVSNAYYSYEYTVPQSSELAEQDSITVVRVHQRIKADLLHDSNTFDSNVNEEENGQSNDQSSIWALIEYEHNLGESADAFIGSTKRFQRWRKFSSENDLTDHIRRNTGEPIHLPPYSLSPIQSQQIEEEARQAVAHVTEEFRRFRVRAEVSRKQADATVKALQSNNVQTAQRHIEGQDLATELEQARTDHEQLEKLRADFAEQEAQWKEAYDVLLHENNALKSSGSEALLAAQWRQRYETCLMEKEKAETALAIERQKLSKESHDRKKEDAGKYESKYKDLKESFRLYRKKAKEIFEAQQNGDMAVIQNMGDSSSEDAKISYLRNLMVNYLSSDPAVREHMEGAIGTVLKFSSDDCERITKQKKLHQEGTTSSWFG